MDEEIGIFSGIPRGMLTFGVALVAEPLAVSRSQEHHTWLSK
jgi:hypothetical protein